MDNEAQWTPGFPVKYTLRLSPDEAKKLYAVASIAHLAKSEVFRVLVEWSYQRAIDFNSRYPGDHSVYGRLEHMLNWNFDAARLAMIQKFNEEKARLAEWQQARAADGEKINYRLNGRALDFYLGAWQRGKSAAELLAAYEAAEARAIANGRKPPAVPAAETAEPERLVDEWGELEKANGATPAEPVNPEVLQLKIDLENAGRVVLVLLGLVVVLVVAVVGLLIWRASGC